MKEIAFDSLLLMMLVSKLSISFAQKECIP